MNNQEIIDEFKRNVNGGIPRGLFSSNLSLMLHCGYPSNDELLHELNNGNRHLHYNKNNNNITDIHDMCTVLVDAVSKIRIDDAFFRFYTAIKNNIIYRNNDVIDKRIYSMSYHELRMLSLFVAKEWLNDNGESSKKTMRGYLSTSDFSDVMQDNYLIQELDRYYDDSRHLESKLKNKIKKVFDIHNYPYAILRDIQHNLCSCHNVANLSFHETVELVKDSIVHEINTGNDLISLNTIERFDHVDNNYFKEMDLVNYFIDDVNIDKSHSGTVTNFNNAISSNIIISEYQMNRIKLINPNLINALSDMLIVFGGDVKTRESDKNGTCTIYKFTKDILEYVSPEYLSHTDDFISGHVQINSRFDYNDNDYPWTNMINNFLEDNFVLHTSIK